MLSRSQFFCTELLEILIPLIGFIILPFIPFKDITSRRKIKSLIQAIFYWDKVYVHILYIHVMVIGFESKTFAYFNHHLDILECAFYLMVCLNVEILVVLKVY